MTVHVVATWKAGLVAALRRVCDQHEQVAHWEESPPPSRVVAGDAVVVDLVDLPVGVRCDEFRKLVPRAELLAVSGPGSVDSAWLSVVAHQTIRLVHCDEAARRDGFAPAVDALAGHLGGPTADELVSCVLEQEPRFRGLSELVAAVCRSPGGIRRPADLARAAGVSERLVVGLCGAVGYKRVEHFLCAVRLALHRCLVTQHGKSSSSAWARAGVSDRSNFARQVARAQRASRKAFDWSRSALLLALAIAGAGCTHAHTETDECGRPGFEWRDTTSVSERVAIRPTVDIAEAGSASELPWLDVAPNLVRLPDGRIIVADLDANQLLVFDSVGDRLDTWGRRGAGPGEFRSLVAIGSAGGDSVWAYDPDRLRVTIFDPSGRVVRSAALDFAGASWSSLLLGRLGDGRFVVAEAAVPGRTPHAPGTVGTDSTRLHMYRLGAGESAPFGWFRVRDVFVSEAGIRDLVGVAPFGRKAVFGVVDSGLYYGFPTMLEIVFYPTSGEARRILAVNRQGRAVTRTDVLHFKQSFLNPDQRDLLRRSERVLKWLPFPPRLPAFRAFVVDDRGRVWVKEYSTEWEPFAKWTVFASDGSLLGALCAPSSFRVATVLESSILGKVEDEDGAVHVLVVPLPPSLLPEGRSPSVPGGTGHAPSRAMASRSTARGVRGP